MPRAVPTHPDQVRRHIVLDEVQLQVVLGSLLGDGRVVGGPGRRRLRVTHSSARLAYVRWKYERLGALAADPPRVAAGVASFDTLEHPMFDDLAGLERSALIARLAPLGLAVWLSDVGRLHMGPDALLPDQRRLALTA